MDPTGNNEIIIVDYYLIILDFQKLAWRISYLLGSSGMTYAIYKILPYR